MKELISSVLQIITEAFLGLSCYLRTRLNEQCKNRSKRVRLYFLEQIVSLNLDMSVFDVIYVGKVNRKPTDPKLIFLILVAKEILSMTDQEILEELKDNRQIRELFKINDDSQIPCRKTLTRFRKRLEKHYRRTGENLVEKVINSLIQAVQLTNLNIGDQVVFRIDSSPIEAFLKEHNRMQLFYTTLASFVNGLVKNDVELPDSLVHYTDKNEYNRWFYHKREKPMKEIYWSILIEDILTILKMQEEIKQKSSYYEILLRLIDEQTRFDQDGNLVLRDDISASSLQSPFDPEATYRYKNGEGHVGYAINFVEMIFKDEEGKIIARHLVYYQVEQNIYSDSQFLKDFLLSYEKLESLQRLVGDGAYFSEENERLAREKNFILIPTELTGQKTDPFLKDFKISEDGKEFVSCPGEKTPRRATYNESNATIRLSFNIADCKSCKFKDKCKPKLKKRVANRVISQKMVHRAKIRDWMSSEAYQEFSQIRNGVESIPSQLKNVYSINQIKQHGLFNTSMNSGFKFLSLALSKLVDTWITHCFPEVDLVA